MSAIIEELDEARAQLSKAERIASLRIELTRAEEEYRHQKMILEGAKRKRSEALDAWAVAASTKQPGDRFTKRRSPFGSQVVHEWEVDRVVGRRTFRGLPMAVAFCTVIKRDGKRGVMTETFRVDVELEEDQR